MAFRPLSNLVLIKPDDAPKTSLGGIILADQSQTAPKVGTIKAIGPGLRKKGTITPVSVKVGQRVIYGTHSVTEIVVDGESCLLMPETTIMGIEG